MFSGTFHLEGVEGVEFEGPRINGMRDLFGIMLPRIIRDIESVSAARAHAASTHPVQEPAERAAIDTLLDSHAYVEGSSKSSAEMPDGATTRSRAVGAAKRARTDENDHGCCPICLDDRNEGDGSIRMPCCSQRFHRQCILDWFVKESDTCPTCRGVLERPTKRTRRAYSALSIAELKKRCAERGIDATKCLEKEELCLLLDSERERADRAQQERKAQRDRERAGGLFEGFAGGIRIPIRMPLFAAQMAAASIAAAARAGGATEMNNATTNPTAEAPAPAPAASRSTRAAARARATRSTTPPPAAAAAAPAAAEGDGASPAAAPPPSSSAPAPGPNHSTFRDGPSPALVRAMFESVARASGRQEPAFIHVTQAPPMGLGALPIPISMMVARMGAPAEAPASPSPSPSASASASNARQRSRRGGS